MYTLPLLLFVFHFSIANRPSVGAIYFGNWHVDPHNELYHGKNWTEWELVQKATPRFPGHLQPKTPLWGYEDESDPEIMAKKIDTASSFGIDFFLFDWYHYNNDTFFLEDTLQKAPNNNKIRFALMWANHNWTNIFPYPYSHAVRGDPADLIFNGCVNNATWENMTTFIIEEYFKHPQYFLIDNSPFFSIFLPGAFIECFGGAEGAKYALDVFRQKTKDAGFDDLHVNGNQLPKVEIVNELSLNSVTQYNWGSPSTWPTGRKTKWTIIYLKGEYSQMVEQAVHNWYQQVAKYSPIPYIPNVSVGWDSTPREVQSDRHENLGYPYLPVAVNNNPSEFAAALGSVSDFLMNQNNSQLNFFIINSWNEWTEGSYLEPDVVNKFEYLEAILNIFGTK